MANTLTLNIALKSSSFSQQIKESKNEVKQLEQGFKTAKSASKEFESTLQGQKAKLESLESKLKEINNRQKLYADEIKNTKDTLQKLQTTQEKNKAIHQSDIAQLNDYKKSYGENSQACKNLQKVIDEDVATIKKQDSAIVSSKNHLSAMETEYLKTKETANKLGIEINDVTKEMKSMGDMSANSKQKLNEFASNMETTGTRIKNAGAKISSVGRTLSLGLTTPLVAIGTAAVKSSIDFESAFTGVRKTVDATEEQFAALEKGILDMSSKMPTSANDIAGVAEAAGQLGIKTENILGFTEVMVKLGDSTNLSADEAATALARLANITQMPQDKFENLGSTIVALGNNFATTESEITQMALRIAGAGKQLGMSEDKIAAVAAALSSVGIEAEAGGSAISKVMIDMQLSVEAGGAGLEQFASVAGMSADEFSKAFKEDAAQALNAFIVGLGKSEEKGQSTIKVLDDMGITEVRMRDALLRLAGAGDVLSNTLDVSSKAWNDNTALSKEAETRYKTVQSQISILVNNLKRLGITIANNIMPTVSSAIQSLNGIIEKFQNLSPETQNLILKMAVFAAAIGPVMLVVGKLTTGVGMVVTKIGALAQAISYAGGIMPFISTAIMPVISTVGALIAIVGVVALSIKENWNGIKAATENLINTCKPHFDSLGAAFSSLWQICQQIYTDYIQPLFMAIGVVIEQCIVAATPMLSSLIDIFTSVVITIVNVWNSFGKPLFDIMKAGVKALMPVFETSFKIITTAVSTAFTLISAVWVNVLSPVLNTIIGVIGTVYNTVSGFISRFAEPIQTAMSIVMTPIQWVIDKISSLIGWLSSAMKSVNNFSSKVGGFLGKLNPFNWFSLDMEPILPKVDAATMNMMINDPQIALKGSYYTDTSAGSAAMRTATNSDFQSGNAGSYNSSEKLVDKLISAIEEIQIVVESQVNVGNEKLYDGVSRNMAKKVRLAR